ncbi:hypothetical protein Bbelb_288820 [Branchiostoma belcheri]|nr:hypothetical protein Bbelb_288820 [Branchiostoma belcheri]
MVGLITAGIRVGLNQNIQDHGNPMVPSIQGSTNWSTTFIVMTEPEDTTPSLLGTTNGTTSLGGTNGLGTPQPHIGTFLTFGGHGKVWKREDCSVWKKMWKREDCSVWKKMRKRLYSKFNHVSGLTVSSTNELFVADNWNRRIQVFSMKGDFLRSFDTGKMRPLDIAMDQDDTLWVLLTASVAVDKEGNIYITEQQNHSVLKYDKNGKYIKCFGRKGDEFSNHLKSPFGICVDSLGRIIVADNGNNRVEMFTAEGEYIANIANITHPQRVAIGKEGELIVSSENHYVTIFPKY